MTTEQPATTKARLIRLRVVLGLMLLPGFAAAAAPDPADDRWVTLGRLWATVEFFHPRTANPSFDWQSAVISTIPSLGAASNAAEMKAALQSLLSSLQDPVTRVLQAPQKIREPQFKEPSTTVLQDGVLLVTAEGEAGPQAYNTLLDAVSKANAVVFDFRKLRQSRDTFDLSSLGRALSSGPLIAPGQRRRVYQGDRLNEAGFLIDGGRRFESVPGARNRCVVFVLGADTQPPDVALALQAKGNGWIVVEGTADESSSVEKWTLQFPFDVQVQIRASELFNPDGTAGFQPDITIASGGLEKALEIARSPAGPDRRRKTVAAPLAEARKPWMDIRFEPRSTTDELYPPEGERLIGAYRVWSMIHLMDPFRESSRAEWDRVLAEFTPKVLTAPNAEAYHLAIAEMVARAHDPHAITSSPVLNTLLLPLPNPPLAITEVEGRMVVTRVLDGVTTVRPGDILHAVDGQSIDDFQQRYARYHCCGDGMSNPGLRGPEGSTVELTVEGEDGRRRNVQLTRTRTNYRAYYPAREGSPVKRLPGDIGYVDLERLEESQLDATLEQLRDTKGLIFDLRGGARFTAWPLAARLTQRDMPPAAKTISRLVSSPSVLLPPGAMDLSNSTNTRRHRDTMQEEIRTLPQTALWRYDKPTVALINHSSTSSPEISAMLLKVGAGTKLIGSRTTGAFGIRMIFNVPGGIRASYTGVGMQFPDGKDAQSVGLLPDIAIEPTIIGLREGRDEVLERALQELGVTQSVRGVSVAR